MKDEQIYLIPGLGADERMYDGLLKQFPDATVLTFIRPGKNESIQQYTRRLSEKIDLNRPVILVGTSLGGIIAIEISHFLPVQKVILISSVKQRSELPRYFQICKYLPIHRAFSGNHYKKFNGIVGFFLSGRKVSPVRRLIQDMAADADPVFIEWAIHEVVNWENNKIPDNLLHIHGNKDIMFPHYFVKNARLVEGGTHIMAITKVKELAEIINQEINNTTIG